MDVEAHQTTQVVGLLGMVRHQTTCRVHLNGSRTTNGQHAMEVQCLVSVMVAVALLSSLVHREEALAHMTVMRSHRCPLSVLCTTQ